MPLLGYRGSGSGARLIFGVSPREFLRLHTDGVVNKNPIYGSIIVITTIVLVIVFLVLAPNSVQPMASYIAFSLLLLLPLIFILVILYNQFKKKFFPSEVPISDDNAGEHHNGSYAVIKRHSSLTTIQSPNEYKLSISSTLSSHNGQAVGRPVSPVSIC